MINRFCHIILLLVVAQVATAQDSTLSTWFYNPTSSIEIRYQTLKADSSIYQGSYQLFNNGEPQIIGTYYNDYKQGEWRRLYASGTVSMRANYHEGYRHGMWTFFYPDGQLASSMSFNYDAPTGHWKSYYENGNVAKEVDYAADSVVNFEIYYHDNGKKAREVYYSYTASALYQVEKKYYRNSNLYTESYKKNGQLDSVYKKYFSNGELWEELVYKSGALKEVKSNNNIIVSTAAFGSFSGGNGTLFRFHASGKIHSSTIYKSGIRDGAVSYHNEKNKVWVGQYKNNLRDGVWTEFGEKKKKARTVQYFEGKDSVYVEKFFGKDVRIASYYCVRGLIDGPSIAYDFSGDTLKMTEYSDGVKHGKGQVFKNNKLLEEGEYRSGVRTGKWTSYSAAGKVYDTISFANQATHVAGSFRQQELFETPPVFDDYNYSAVRIAGDFYGGRYDEERYVGGHLLYPIWAREESIHGDVLLEISLSEMGEIVHIQVVRGIGYHCDEEAIGVISAVPFWDPELLNGFPVPTKLLRTISF
jgi:antitoxin component YwqK of YwqJK toxin-antitoxin module